MLNLPYAPRQPRRLPEPINFAGIICFLPESRYILRIPEYELRITL